MIEIITSADVSVYVCDGERVNPFAVRANLAPNQVDIFDHIAAVLSHIKGSKECSCVELSNGMFSYFSSMD